MKTKRRKMTSRSGFVQAVRKKRSVTHKVSGAVFTRRLSRLPKILSNTEMLYTYRCRPKSFWIPLCLSRAGQS